MCCQQRISMGHASFVSSALGTHAVRPSEFVNLGGSFCNVNDGMSVLNFDLGLWVLWL